MTDMSAHFNGASQQVFSQPLPHGFRTELCVDRGDGIMVPIFPREAIDNDGSGGGSQHRPLLANTTARNSRAPRRTPSSPSDQCMHRALPKEPMSHRQVEYNPRTLSLASSRHAPPEMRPQADVIRHDSSPCNADREDVLGENGASEHSNAQSVFPDSETDHKSSADNQTVAGTSIVQPSRSLPPSGQEPNLGLKRYCTYWIRKGECDYMQQGCMYKHEMPDRTTLEGLGFIRLPVWWQEKLVRERGLLMAKGLKGSRRMPVRGKAPPKHKNGRSHDSQLHKSIHAPTDGKPSLIHRPYADSSSQPLIDLDDRVMSQLPAALASQPPISSTSETASLRLPIDDTSGPDSDSASTTASFKSLNSFRSPANGSVSQACGVQPHDPQTIGTREHGHLAFLPPAQINHTRQFVGRGRDEKLTGYNKDTAYARDTSHEGSSTAASSVALPDINDNQFGDICNEDSKLVMSLALTALSDIQRSKGLEQEQRIAHRSKRPLKKFAKPIEIKTMALNGDANIHEA